MKKVSVFSGIVMPLLVIGITVALFLLLRGEQPSALYWVNFAYTLLLELGLFGWVGWMRQAEDETSSFLKIAMGTFGWLYMVAGVLIMICFAVASLWLTVDIRWYIAVQLVVFAIWLVPSAWLAESDSSYRDYRRAKKGE